MKYRHCNFHDALAFVEDFYAIPHGGGRRERRVDAESTQEGPGQRRMRLLMALWAEATPVVAGDPVWEYLKARGLKPAFAGLEVRCHRHLLYVGEEGRLFYPAMIARLTDDKGNLVNLHRTYLKDGAKAPVASPKKAMSGTFKGAFVRFGVPQGVLGLAEGIETALACRELFHVPVWASIGVANLLSFSAIPPGVKSVQIYADNDKNLAGQAAAYRLAHTLLMRGIDAKVIVAPESGSDWLDFLKTTR